MPGAGRPGDPLWFAIGFAIGIAPGIYFHQLGLGVGLGLVLGGAFGLVRADIKNKYTRPVDPLWFAIALAIGLLAGLWLRYLGLGWRLGIGLGLALGFVLGAVLGTVRADLRRNQARRT